MSIKLLTHTRIGQAKETPKTGFIVVDSPNSNHDDGDVNMSNIGIVKDILSTIYKIQIEDYNNGKDTKLVSSDILGALKEGHNMSFDEAKILLYKIKKNGLIKTSDCRTDRFEGEIYFITGLTEIGKQYLDS